MSIEELESVVPGLPAAELAGFLGGSRSLPPSSGTGRSKKMSAQVVSTPHSNAPMTTTRLAAARRFEPFCRPDFCFHYRQLPADIQALADKKFALLKVQPRHSSLRFKKVGVLYSVRIGLHYLALARKRSNGFQWFWIGHHSTYDRLANPK